MDIYNKINNDPKLVALVLVILILLIEFARYKRVLYYNFDGEKFKNHVLSKTFKLPQRRYIVDLKSINLHLFFGQIVSLIISGVFMAYISLIGGFIIYLILGKTIGYIISTWIGAKYQRKII